MDTTLTKEALDIKKTLAGLALIKQLSSPIAMAGPEELALWKAMSSKMTPTVTERVTKASDMLGWLERLGLQSYGKEKLIKQLAKLEAGKRVATEKGINIPDLSKLHSTLTETEKNILSGKGVDIPKALEIKDTIPEALKQIEMKLKDYKPTLLAQR